VIGSAIQALNEHSLFNYFVYDIHMFYLFSFVMIFKKNAKLYMYVLLLLCEVYMNISFSKSFLTSNNVSKT